MSEENVEPEGEPLASDAFAKGLAEAQKIVQHQDRRLLESVNATASVKQRQAWTPDILAERSALGYQSGKTVKIQVVTVDGLLIEKNTAYDYLLMRRAATKAGISLLITSAYRSNDQQTRIYNQRYTNGVLNAVGRKKGEAARPGYSNHQMGKALDIKVGLTVADLAAGSHTPTYLWLTSNAHLYGFVNSVPKEPWHWSHPEDRVVGAHEDEETYRNLVSVGAVAPLAVDDGRSGVSLLLGRELNDRVSAWQKSLLMSTSPRSAIIASQGEHAAFRGSATALTLANLRQADTSASRARPSFSGESLKPLEYDFDSGTWGDGKPV